MLLDVILACAPVAVVAPAAIVLRTGDLSWASMGRLQKRLYQALLLAEKLPAGVPGSAQITADVERQTLQVAYRAQYPQRAREIVGVALIGAGLLGTVTAYYVALWAGASPPAVLVTLVLMVIAGLWLRRALGNFIRNDTLIRDLFGRLGAPQTLHRPHTELVARTPALSVEALLQRAANDRDSAKTTLDAVNSILAEEHSHTDWRLEAHELADRLAHTDFRAHAVASYDWLLRHLLGPFFRLRLAYLDERERRRIATADRTGDVYRSAWLARYYRDERSRLAQHWTHLHGARETLSKWGGDGTTPHAPSPPVTSDAVNPTDSR